MIRLFTFIGSLLLFSAAQAQNSGGRITGNLQANGNFFFRDSTSGAYNTPQYDYQKYGSETWLNLNYNNWGYDIGVRFDLFNNSNLRNPNDSYTAQGIGRWYAKKEIHGLEITGGYIYDQIGTGIIFRAYEERALSIDNALYGLRLAYQINPNWRVKAFTGRQKFFFDAYNANIRGANIEGFIKPDSSKNFSLVPGFGITARTLDQGTVEKIASNLSTVPLRDNEGGQYNTYAASLYNTLNVGNFTWYVEGAYKSKDVMYAPLEPKTGGGLGRLINRAGNVVYSSFSWSGAGLGISLEAKRTENFNYRVGPFETGVRGALNYLPPLTRQNTYRLTTRYSPATQEFGEQGLQLDAKYAVSKKLHVGVNVSAVQDLNGEELYREVYPEITYKYKRKWQLITGVQIQRYNQKVYEGKNSYVNTLIPYAEWLYKFTARRSMRIEAQYLNTKDDIGKWAFGLVEIGLAPHWIFTVSDMYKIKHSETTDANGNPISTDKTKFDGLHYPTAGIVYTYKANRFGLAFVKQVEGINCSGGICRFEPAFYGIRANVNSAF